jgi:methionyl aminopeptidase
VVRDFTGHGVGFSVHEQPNVPHYGRKNSGLVLREGLVIAIEPMINEGTEKVITLEDGWTTVTADGKLSAQFEHTVAVTSDGPLVLTE